MVQLDSDHVGPLANLAAWITIAVAVLLGAAKVFTKWRITHELYYDDGIMVLSIIFAIGTTVAVGFQVDNGLGQHADQVSQDQLNNLLKSIMATDVLYLLTIFCAKLSLIHFLRNFTRENRRRVIVEVFLYSTFVWTVVSVFTIAFRCSIPQTWNILGGHCINLDAFWTVNTVVDILTQTITAFMPIALLYDVRIAWTKKKLAILSYLPVITTVPFEILRILAIWHSDITIDTPFSLFHPTLWTIVHANYSIIASTSTFLIPIMEALSVGTISSQVILHPKLENSHVRRSQPLFDVTTVLGGRRFMNNTNTMVSSAGNSGSDRKGSVGFGRIQKIFGGQTHFDGEDEGITQLGADPRYGSREHIAIDRLTTSEDRTTSSLTVREEVPRSAQS